MIECCPDYFTLRFVARFGEADETLGNFIAKYSLDHAVFDLPHDASLEFVTIPLSNNTLPLLTVIINHNLPVLSNGFLLFHMLPRAIYTRPLRSLTTSSSTLTIALISPRRPF